MIPARKTSARRSMVRLTMVATFVVALLTFASPAWAETFPVETTADSGNSSLRWAIGEANKTDEADTIVFGLDAGSTITLSETLTVTKPLTIEAPPWLGIKISDNNEVRPFYVDRTTLNISGLTIADGSIPGALYNDTQAYHGGAIFNQGGELTISDSVLTGGLSFNAYRGGAIYNQLGTLSLINSSISGYDTVYGGTIYNYFASTTTLAGSTLSGNSAWHSGGAIYNLGSDVNVTAGSRLEGNGAARDGGGVFNKGTLRVTDSTFADNRGGDMSTKSGNGGGVYSFGNVEVQRSTFSGNAGYESGGGLYAESGNIEVRDSTFHGNTVGDESGGGIAIVGGSTPGGGSATVTNSTVTGNSAEVRGGGIWVSPAATIAPTIRGSVVAGNTAYLGNPDVEGNYADGGFNLIGGTADEAKLKTDANGKPVLEGNGGPTKTVALVRGSKAIDAGNSFGATADQRGTPRPKDYASLDNAEGGDGSDVGAFEYVDPDAAPPTVEARPSPLPDEDGLNNSDVTVAIDAFDEEGGSGVWRISYSASGAQQVPEQNVPGDSAELVVSDDGETTVTYWATDMSGNRSESRTVIVRLDTTAPNVDIVTPPSGKKGVNRNITPAATFSEKMNKDTISKVTFKLFRINSDRPRTQITNVAVELSANGLKAKLDPFGTSTKLLAKNTKYRAVVTTGAKDLAGNRLDQDPSTEGNQRKGWTFTTGSS